MIPLQAKLIKNKLGIFFQETLISNAVYILGVIVLPAIAGFLFWWLASQLYSSEEIGKASAIISAITLISWIAGLGTNFGIIRLLPEAEFPNRMLNSIYTVNIVTSLFAGVIFVIGIPFWSPALSFLLGNLYYQIIFYLFVLVSSLGTVIRDTFVVYRNAKYAFAYTIIAHIARLTLIWIGISQKSLGLVQSNSIAYTIALILAWSIFLPKVNSNYRIQFIINKDEIKNVIPYSLGNYFTSLLSQLNQTILPIMILQELGANLSGYAYITMMVGLMLTSPGLALANSAFAEMSNFPEMASLYLRKAAKVGLLVTIPLALIGGILSPLILDIFGKSYSVSGTGLLRLLAFSAPFIVIVNIYISYLRFVKKLNLLFLFTCVITGVTLSAAAFFLRVIGIEGSGYGILIGNLLGFVIILLLNKNLLFAIPITDLSLRLIGKSRISW